MSSAAAAPVVVVSGLPRSGTSLAMQILGAGGLRTVSDGARPPDLSNPRGYHEHDAIKRLGSDLDADALVRGAGGRAVKIIHTLAARLPRGPRYRVVWMERDPNAVVASQDAMLRRRGEKPGDLPPDRVAELLAQEAERIRVALEAREDCRVLRVRLEELGQRPDRVCGRLAAFVTAACPIRLDVDAMVAAVAPILLGRAPTDGYTPPMSVSAHESVGTLRIEVEHRARGSEGGPTLRVRDAADGRERLRFDCFARGAHWHADPAGRDEISQVPPGVESIEWVLGELRSSAARYLASANVEGVDVAAFVAACDRLEPAIRNGPARFDRLDPAILRQRTGEKWRQYPDDVLPLWVADMDFEVADPIRRALQRALDLGDLGYPWHPQPTAIPGLFADRMQRLYGWDVDPRRIELLTEVVQGMHVAVHQFSEPGDGVIVQPPIYPPFVGTVQKLGRRLESNALREAEVSYTLDLDLLREQAARSKILLFCNPHNPTGRVLRRAELEAIAEIAIEHDLLVVSDEIHQELVYAGSRHIPIASLSPEIAERTITITSASKAFNIAGLRLAVAVFGSAALRQRFTDFPRHIRGGMNSLGIMATEAAWRHSDPWLAEVRAYLQANRDFVAEFVRSEMPGMRHDPPEATYLAWFDCRALELPQSPGPFFLEHARVGLSDGPSFGAQGEGFVRLNFSTSRAILEEALGRMAKALRSR